MPLLKLIGPFANVVTMDNLPARGSLSEKQLQVITDAGILLRGNMIEAVGRYDDLVSSDVLIDRIEGQLTVIPGLIDVHTHLCWAGSRAVDYGMRLEGLSYVEIAEKGGGIWSTVLKTRNISEDDLAKLTLQRVTRQLTMGITTMEVKSGYCLNVEGELKMLRAIRRASENSAADVISTCLAAHIKPTDFSGKGCEYLDVIIHDLLPEVARLNLASRVDMYIDKGAFSLNDGRYYLQEASKMGFDLTVHADQFVEGGLEVAIDVHAVSADHLESTSPGNLKALASSGVIPVVLPGASMGLGMNFAPARKILDAGASLVIASDWNPGSAPMGNLLLQSAVLGAYEHLTMAETLAAITCRAAGVLKLNDRGILRRGMRADFIAFPCTHYHEILYNQGSMMPVKIWKDGEQVI